MYTKPSKSKHKSRDRWGPWSEWIWSAEHGRSYRYRSDANNEYDYQWEQQAAQADTADATIPRQAEGVDEITDGVENLSTDYDPANPATHEAEYTPYPYRSGGSNTTHTKGKSKNRKGKAVAQSYSEEEERGEEAPETIEDPRGTSDETGDEPHFLDPFYGHQNKTPRNTSQFPTPSYDDRRTGYEYGAYGPEPYEASDPISQQQQYPTEELPRVQDTEYVTGGHGEDYVPHRPAYSSSQGMESLDSGIMDQEDEEDQDDDEYAQETARAQQESRDMYQNMRQGSSSQSAYIAVSAEDEGGRMTPRPHSPKALDIRGTGGYTENLDPRYQVEISSKFQPGEVFKVLWSEPQGQVGGTPTISDWKEIRNQFGSFYVGFRRFIVIANDEGHCTCVPILTYNGRGCKKRGIKPQKHGIIYEKGHKARPLENEPKLGFTSVRMMIKQEAGGEKLSRESRVNYSKLMTIEHNVKVFFIGYIVPEDWDIVRDAVNKCWEDKSHHRRKRQFQK